MGLTVLDDHKISLLELAQKLEAQKAISLRRIEIIDAILYGYSLAEANFKNGNILLIPAYTNDYDEIYDNV